LETEFIGFPGSRTQTVAATGLVFSKIPALGLRIKTEIKGFPRSRTQTVVPAGPEFSKCPAHGLRIKTEFKGFPGSRTQTAAAASLQASGSRSAYTKRLLRNSGAAFFLYLNY
jgi:hypothetical protein